jgi:O-methyltransferase involved in polyketide biosynthesis
VVSEISKSPISVSGVPETALITLYGRATEAARPDALLHDPLAVSLLMSLDFPFQRRFGHPDQNPVIRALQFDRVVRAHLAAFPGAMVIALGEGLETQLWRVDDGTVEWVSVDLPEMIDLRRRLLPTHPRNRLVSCSALDPEWTARLDPEKPTLIIAQGLLMYFSVAQVTDFLRLLTDHAAGARVVFDTIPTWAATTTGHHQTPTYRMPPQPWGTGRAALLRLLSDHGLRDARILATARGHGVMWRHLYPLLTRVLPGLLPMTVTFTVPAR